MKSIICLMLLCMAASLDCSNPHNYTYFPEADAWMKLHTTPSTWYDARLRCLLEEGKLASPLDTELQQAMQLLINKNTPRQDMVYTGIHATFSKGDFFSIEGVPLSKMPIRWADNEPNNLFDQVSCLVMLQDGTVANVKCNDTHPSVCYRKFPRNPFLNECGTADNNYKLDPQTGKCYKFHTVPRTWDRAVSACAAEGGHLVVIDNEIEANVIKEMFAKQQKKTTLGNSVKNSAFIGFYCWGRNREWVTIDDRPRDEVYHKFASGEPNNAGGKQFCATIYDNGELDDNWCNIPKAFICEKSPKSLF